MRPSGNVELDARAVDRGRLDGDAEADRLAPELGDLVGVPGLERQRGGHELDRVVRLHPGRLVGDEGIGRRVGLVEAVLRELGAGVEDGDGGVPVDPALGRAHEEAAALGVHLGLDLLAHGAAQEVGLGERIAGQILGDLLDLLLVGDDAVGRLEDRLQRRMEVLDRLAPELPGAIGRNVRHRPRPVERDQRDQVLEAVGLHVDQRSPHARAFHLEHADRLAAGEHLVGLLVVERDAGEIDLDPAAADEPDRDVEHRQRLQAEEVELHQPRLLDPLHVELGDLHAGARIAVERHQPVERPVADDDAGGMGRGVAVEAFELLGHGEEPGHHRLLVAHRLEPRLVGDRLLQRDRRGRVERDHLGDPVDLAVGHLQHAADVAEHGARLERAEGDDLRHPVGAVFAPGRSGSPRRAGSGRSRCRSRASTRGRD